MSKTVRNHRILTVNDSVNSVNEEMDLFCLVGTSILGSAAGGVAAMDIADAMDLTIEASAVTFLFGVGIGGSLGICLDQWEVNGADEGSIQKNYHVPNEEN